MVISTTRPPSAVTVLEIDALPAPYAGTEALAQDGVALRSGPLHGRRVVVRLDEVTVIYHATDLRVRIRTQVLGDYVACVVFGPRATGSIGGFRLRPGMLVVAELGDEADFVAEPGYESIAMLVPAGTLPARLSFRHEHGSHVPPDVAVFRADPLQTRRLFRQGRRVVAAAEKAPALFDGEEPRRRAAETDLMDSLLATVCSSRPLTPVGTEKTRCLHARIVSLAEGFALARIEQRVMVSQLCRAADVSERTLESAFMEITGLSPAAYLRRLRLHRVRAALLAAKPDTTVAAEAANCGFWHFGEFSRAYTECFGELPSQTLRRAQGRRGGPARRDAPRRAAVTREPAAG